MPLPAVTPLRVAVLAAVVAAVLALCGIGVLLPYFVNDLHLLALQEVASGAHDPKDLWPHGPVGGLVQLAGLSGVLLGPLVVLVVPVLCLVDLWSIWRVRGASRPSRGLVVGLVVLIPVCASALAFLFSPTGEALETWRRDGGDPRAAQP